MNRWWTNLKTSNLTRSICFFFSWNYDKIPTVKHSVVYRLWTKYRCSSSLYTQRQGRMLMEKYQGGLSTFFWRRGKTNLQIYFYFANLVFHKLGFIKDLKRVFRGTQLATSTPRNNKSNHNLWEIVCFVEKIKLRSGRTTLPAWRCRLKCPTFSLIRGRFIFPTHFVKEIPPNNNHKEFLII